MVCLRVCWYVAIANIQTPTFSLVLRERKEYMLADHHKLVARGEKITDFTDRLNVASTLASRLAWAHPPTGGHRMGFLSVYAQTA